nr:hypothetical protein [Staphylococcus saprophyticus]
MGVIVKAKGLIVCGIGLIGLIMVRAGKWKIRVGGMGVGMFVGEVVK